MTGERTDDANGTGTGTGERAIVTSVDSAFEAHTIVAVLEDAGIEAVALDAAQAHAQTPLGGGSGRVPIQVARDDLPRAREVLEASGAGTTGVEWSEVDVGEREDDLPLSPAGRMPPAARVAFAIAIAVVVLIAVLAVLSAVIP